MLVSIVSHNTKNGHHLFGFYCQVTGIMHSDSLSSCYVTRILHSDSISGFFLQKRKGGGHFFKSLLVLFFVAILRDLFEKYYHSSINFEADSKSVLEIK